MVTWIYKESRWYSIVIDSVVRYGSFNHFDMVSIQIDAIMFSIIISSSIIKWIFLKSPWHNFPQPTSMLFWSLSSFYSFSVSFFISRFRNECKSNCCGWRKTDCLKLEPSHLCILHWTDLRYRLISMVFSWLRNTSSSAGDLELDKDTLLKWWTCRSAFS